MCRVTLKVGCVNARKLWPSKEANVAGCVAFSHRFSYIFFPVSFFSFLHLGCSFFFFFFLFLFFFLNFRFTFLFWRFKFICSIFKCTGEFFVWFERISTQTKKCCLNLVQSLSCLIILRTHHSRQQSQFSDPQTHIH